NRPPILTRSPKSTRGWPTCAPTRRRRARPKFSPGWASPMPSSSAPAPNSPAAGACGSRSPQRCSPNPICSSSTSPPIISTSKARQAQSRLKLLAKLEPIAALVDEDVLPIQIPAPAKPLSPPIVALENAAVGYAWGQPVLRRLNLRIDDDDRIALLGANGNGK